MMENFPRLYEMFPKIYGWKFHNNFGKFPILGEYSPKIDGGKFHNSFGKFTNFGEICVTNILGKIP